MWTWIRSNWWLVLAAIAGGVLVFIGVGLPFEDRTAGAVAGGGVHAIAGVVVLAGLVARRRRPRRGDLMIAVGVLPLLIWFWTIVLPALAVAVMVPALLDVDHAPERATGAVPGSAGS